MRMRVAGAHDGATILKNLNVIDPRNIPQVEVLLNPEVDDASDFLLRHQSHGEIVSLGETYNPADSALAARKHQKVVVEVCGRRVRAEGGKVVVENEGGFVTRVAQPAGARVSGAKVALGVVGFSRGLRDLFHLALPRTVCSLRRNQDPLTCQRIRAPMGMLEKSRLASMRLIHARLSQRSAPSDAEET